MHVDEVFSTFVSQSSVIIYMKRIITIVAAMLLLSVSSFGQVYVNAGVGRSYRNTLVGGEIETKEPATAFVGGLSYNFKLAGNLGLEAGLNYQYDSAKDNLDIDAVSGDSYVLKRRSNLLLPIELNYNFVLSDLFSIKLFAGPDFFYGLTSKSTTVIGGKELSVQAEDLYKKGTYNRFMFGGSFGLAFEMSFGLRLKVGFMFDFTDMYASDIAKMKQNLLSFTLGYGF